MTEYRLQDRLYEPTSWTGISLGLIAYYISQLLPPDALTHALEFVQVFLSTALVMFPENRLVIGAEELIKRQKAASFGSGSLHPIEGGGGSLAGLLMIGALGAFSLGLSACSTPPTPAEIQAVQSISSELACTTQAAANAATASFQASGDTKNAQITSAASAATGSLCTGLAVGTALNTAAPAK
jgi:hypothetical protein